MLKKTTLLFTLLIFISFSARAQMERERVVQEGPVEETFWAPGLIGMSTVEVIGHKNINATIMHSFGLINDEPLHNFLGMDFGASVRLGIDYGITDNWSLGVGRSSPQKQYDFRTKYALFRQTTTDNVPLSITLKGDMGIDTNKNGYSFGDRLNFFASANVARKFNDQLSLQVSPMISHFNTVFTGEEKTHFALGLAGEYHISDRYALMAEYLPVLGERSEGTANAFSVGLNIETGGHVFQLFLKTSDWHTEQHIIAQNDDKFWDGDIRFGFNVNRIFWTGEKQ
ncbi:DUF5777 family beta-barrel protein [Aliifodinibius sp. S!AR15-10]|uniref:DUF5777 family beta-barrel protein n=1 Tax=Aliifodinibius sp. S!AR15-10 TaxID=2950437 RepID=UPI00285BDCFD|nr:DUF5777 family beta-barrel protein [Aliifodinibius sp. S!AR15-10]MDR8391017.1 DUF5777 family beta-barrel protein [Aliifodinibius sp. S!AR15-10]